MQQRVFIIHGWEGSPDANWFPWMKTALEKQHYHVVVPRMPNAETPQQSEWVPYLHGVVRTPDMHTIFVGHSLGVIAILRYVESLPEEMKIGGLVLVAGFSQSIGIAQIENFLTTPVNWGKIKKQTKHIVVIHSDNDPYVPLQQGEILRDKLNAQFILIHNGSHLNEGSGFFQLPEAVSSIINMT